MIFCYIVLKLRVHLDTVYFAENWKHCNKIIFKCVNSVMKPFLMKKLLKKKRFVDPMNSAWDPLMWHISIQNLDFQRGSESHAQCTGPTGRSVSHIHVLLNKKIIKKKKGKRKRSARETQSKRYLSVFILTCVAKMCPHKLFTRLSLLDRCNLNQMLGQ